MRFPSLIRIILISTVAAALPAIPTNPFFPELYGGPVPEDRDITAIDTTPIDTTDYSSKHLQKRGHATCKSLVSSPEVWQLNRAITILNNVGYGGWCTQMLFHGHGASGCTRLNRGTDGGNVWLCGPWADKLKCTEVARAVKEVRNRCTVNNRAGGTWDFNDTELYVKVE